jgi:hypothetical protein
MIRKALITTAAVVTVLGGTATALAVTGSSSGGTVYHGCEGGKLGRTIYDVYSNGTVPKCPAGAWPFSWNSTGPAGPQGPAGPAGKDAAVLGPVFSDTTSQSISTGGAAYENATKLGTLTFDPGTYLLEANFVATPNEVNSAQIFPQLLVTAGGPIESGYGTSIWNAGSGALEQVGSSQLPNDVINSNFSGSYVINVPSGSPETLYFYGFGYDSDTGAGTYTLNAATVSAVELAS